MSSRTRIEFQYVSSAPDDERRRCPICGRIIERHAEETYYREDNGARIQCCSDCRENFERSSDHSLDVDVLTPSLFDAFQDWAWREIESESDSSEEK